MTDQANTQQATGDRRYVDPADLICPECGEQPRCEPPGYWRVVWGLPAAHRRWRHGRSSPSRERARLRASAAAPGEPSRAIRASQATSSVS